jgi:hypothetical protein
MHYLGTVIEKLVSPDEDLRRAERRHRVRHAAGQRRWWWLGAVPAVVDPQRATRRHRAKRWGGHAHVTAANRSGSPG